MNYAGGKNWGDAINPVIYKLLSGRNPKCIDQTKTTKEDAFLCIGSILLYADKHSLVWGAGFHSYSATVKEKPKEVFAVRGPLSRAKLLDMKIECPKVFGDPAILYPLFYRPEYNPKYKLGIIKHCIDRKKKAKIDIENRDDVLVISMLGEINEVVDKICSCECIASSSLHGMIAADAYGLPSCRIWFGNYYGDSFKFHDYRSSIGKPMEKKLKVSQSTSLKEIISHSEEPKTTDSKDLLASCPFLRKHSVDGEILRRSGLSMLVL